MRYCSLQHRTFLLSPVTSTAGYCFFFGSIPSFFLELFLHWSPVAYWAPTDVGSSSLSILSFCLFVLFMGFSRQEYWSGLPFPSPVDHVLSDLSTMTRPSWVAPRVWLSFIELDKAVFLVWLDWLVFCEYGFSVSALWCPLATPTVLLGFLLPWEWGISSQLLQQSAATAPYLDEGYLLTATLPDFQHRIASLGLPAPAQPRLFGHGVAPPGRRPWPWAWGRGVAPLGRGPWPRTLGSSSQLSPWPRTPGSSSQPFRHRRSLALSATAPDLGHGVTPLGCRPSGMGSSRLLPLTSGVG